MDAFADNFDLTPAVVAAEVDPAAEFLAREKDQLAGLEDELTGASSTVAPEAVGVAGLTLDSGKWRKTQRTNVEFCCA